MPYIPLLLLILLTACAEEQQPAPPQASPPPPPAAAVSDSSKATVKPAQAAEPTAQPSAKPSPAEPAADAAQPLNLALPDDIDAARRQSALPEQASSLQGVFAQEKQQGTTLKARPKLQFEDGSIAPQLDGAEVEITVPLN